MHGGQLWDLHFFMNIKYCLRCACVGDLLNEEPTNAVDNPFYTSKSHKNWAENYPSLETQYLKIHTILDQGGAVSANFDTALLPLYADDEKRLKEPCQRPNTRAWRLETESDIELWWHTEISSIALAAFARFPELTQTSHTKPLSEVSIAESVDATYAPYIDGTRVAQLIVEVKRNLIAGHEWQSGRLTVVQRKLAKELRGYADKYQCPLIACVDGQYYLQLQFRAQKADAIRDPQCMVDCWVLPIQQSRYAFYRMLVQGWRRCQVLTAPTLTVGSLTEHRPEFYTGRPIWKVPSEPGLPSTYVTHHPEGYTRMVDAESGAIGWIHESIGGIVWETGRFW
ncbi:hypothetical protein F5Y14DRAFT_462176 [Nemania sp. NC0429]|nr:hypothetical protein F5Y14DRAFT_462176 [Nemania sp. NC0429]